MITIAQSCSPKVYNRWGLPSKPKTPTVSPSPPRLPAVGGRRPLSSPLTSAAGPWRPPPPSSSPSTRGLCPSALRRCHPRSCVAPPRPHRRLRRLDLVPRLCQHHGCGCRRTRRADGPAARVKQIQEQVASAQAALRRSPRPEAGSPLPNPKSQIRGFLSRVRSVTIFPSV
jgi:hypothetical protein